MLLVRDLRKTVPGAICGGIAIWIIVGREPFWWLLLPAGLVACWWLIRKPVRLAMTKRHRLEIFDLALGGMVFVLIFAGFAALYGLSQLIDLVRQ
ncbi:hypothetical protein AAV99_07485 [Aurantiacibacter marinus]|uniref:Uncharacterized protein n=1 Tax=Aurantiacibacter marinus TaxID=874156 RepID=A0A0H0XNS1_9SPHN|nr:hypothetical protein AAV99_07485 [Aurantiacibacter marinus]